MRLIWDVDGVVDVISRVNQAVEDGPQHVPAHAAANRAGSVQGDSAQWGDDGDPGSGRRP
jgi:hypothetical protein